MMSVYVMGLTSEPADFCEAESPHEGWFLHCGAMEQYSVTLESVLIFFFFFPERNLSHRHHLVHPKLRNRGMKFGAFRAQGVGARGHHGEWGLDFPHVTGCGSCSSTPGRPAVGHVLFSREGVGVFMQAFTIFIY